jgi:hypothetical protein
MKKVNNMNVVLDKEKNTIKEILPGSLGFIASFARTY